MHELRVYFARLEEFLSPVSFVVYTESVFLLAELRCRIIKCSVYLFRVFSWPFRICARALWAVLTFVHVFLYRRFRFYRNSCARVQNKYSDLLAALRSGKEFLACYPKAYWGVQTINFLDCTFAFAYGTISIVFLSDVIGFSDENAGYVIAALTVVSVIMALFSGPIIDRVGIKKALYMSAAILIFTRAGLGLSGFANIPATAKMVAAFIFCAAGSLPLSMLGTIYQVSNKSYTKTTELASAGFNVWYLLMNVGAVVAGFVVDFVHVVLAVSWGWILIYGAVISLVNLCIGFFIVTEAKITIEKAKTSILEIVFSGRFRRVVAIVTLLLGVRTAFLYLSVLAPKYWYRAIGPDALVGSLNVINPTLIIISLAFLTLYKPLAEMIARNVYKTLTLGALIAASCFIPLALPWSFVGANLLSLYIVFCGIIMFGIVMAAKYKCIPWRFGLKGRLLFIAMCAAIPIFWPTLFGGGIITAYYAMAIAALIVLSVGEALWSPRLNDYIIACAPEGQTGLYCSFASIPWLIANMVAAGFSGIMLRKWIPATMSWHGEEVPVQTVLATNELPYWQTPEAMWLVLGMIAIVGASVMLLPKIKKWFTEPEYRFFEPRLSKLVLALLFARISVLGYGIREMVFSDVRPQTSEVK